MHTFYDRQGRAFDLAITCDQVALVKSRLGIDLYDLFAGTLRCPECGTPWSEIIVSRPDADKPEDVMRDWRPGCKCLIRAGIPGPAGGETEFRYRVQCCSEGLAPRTLDERLADDEGTMVNVFYVLTEASCERHKVGSEAFGALLATEHTDTLKSAVMAFTGELSDFCRRLHRKMAAFLETMQAMVNRRIVTVRGQQIESSELFTSWLGLLELAQED